MTSLALLEAPELEMPENPSAGVVRGFDPSCFCMEMSNDEYHALPDSVSCTGLKKLLRSPSHYQAYLDDDEGEDEGDNLGSAVHVAVLEPDRFAAEYIFYEGDRRGNAWKDFKEENAGKMIQTRAEYNQVQGMSKALRGHKNFPLWMALQKAQREMSVFWRDEETGVQCRVRFDALSRPYAIWDLKSTTDARPAQFVKQAVRLDYDLQAAMYSEGARRFTGEDMPFIFVAIETKAPHGIWLHTAGQSMLDNGWAKFRRALSIYKDCTDNQRWPGYDNPCSTLEFPRYALLTD